MAEKKKSRIKSGLRALALGGAMKGRVAGALGKKLFGRKTYKFGKVYSQKEIEKKRPITKEERAKIRAGVAPKKTPAKKKETMKERIQRLRKEEAEKMKEAAE